MPTIDELPAALSVSDSDELVVSQSDTARKATRGQILAGVQPALALPQGSLLGRVSAGTGSPEAIAIGPNLSVANGMLSAPPGYQVAEQTAGAPPGLSDLVAIAQGGQNAAVDYATFMSSLASVVDVDVSGLIAAPAGGLGKRRLADLFADALSVESFGAKGDGESDDTEAFLAAAASGHPLLLNSRTYVVNGAVNIAAATGLIGTNATVRRNSYSGGDVWISVDAPSFLACGVTFDAGALAASHGAAVSLGSSCTSSLIQACAFTGAADTANGHGLVINTLGGNHRLADCTFSNNAADGLHVAGSGTLIVSRCLAAANGGTGIYADIDIGCMVNGNTCTLNDVGIGVGSWQDAAPSEGTGSAALLGNNCSQNKTWGIAISAVNAQISHNFCFSNGLSGNSGGLLCRLADSIVSHNRVNGGGVGIDARTSYSGSICSNHILSAATGILAGGSQNLVISENFLLRNTWGIAVSAFEPSLSFEPTGPISISSNWIGFTSTSGGGVKLLDGVAGAAVFNNDINGWGSATVNQALWIHTDAAVVFGNRWNNTAQYSVQESQVGQTASLVVPDTADEVLITAAAAPIYSVITAHQLDTLGQVVFVRVDNGGQDYTTARVSFSGSGSGAAAQAICSGGQVVGILVTNPGSGYGGFGTQLTPIISGDGSGAAATAYVGLPVLPGRKLRVCANAQLRLNLSGSAPAQQTWSQYSLTVPAFGAVDLVGAFGGWYAVSSPPVDYLAPLGDGGAVLQSVGGADVFLRPSAGGRLHVASGSEPTGCTSGVGRGSPNGSLAAPPGSDFRNLNGGSGSTFWIKCSGTDSSGWVAIA